MSTLKSFVIVALAFSAQSASASSFFHSDNPVGNFSLTTGFTIASPFLSTTCAVPGAGCVMHDKQILLEAKEDAAVFVGTEGQILGVRLQRAIQLVHEANPEVEASDMEIANSILELN